jgi:hypothetical protein
MGSFNSLRSLRMTVLVVTVRRRWDVREKQIPFDFAQGRLSALKRVRNDKIWIVRGY